MLPTTQNGGQRRTAHKGGHMGAYLRRLYKPKQMDTEYTFWLMLQLCISPKTAYRHTAYHKQTKNQWARDDPAFVAVCCVLVSLAATAYCVTYGHSAWRSVTSILAAVLVDFLLIGLLIATGGWFISNRFLRRPNLPHQVEQHVEWLYAFDVHCNSFFPLFLLLYVLQFLLSPLLLWKSFVSAVLSSILYVAALSYYHYLNFLGYSALPFLQRTEVFLWPIGLIVLALPLAVLTGFNPTRFTLGIYFG